ncbi:MAG TPA: endolytic transglycosylase MltG [Chitinophagaceae bacterium]|nr:endolytic transglycosylase MltG [Chitinophagaceae bacterium]
MKKIIKYSFVAILILALTGAWLLLSNATTFEKGSKYFFVTANADSKNAFEAQLASNNALRYPNLFLMVANTVGVWEKLKSGRFELTAGENILSFVRKLRNNKQASVKLVLNKERTPQDIAGLLAQQFQIDSAGIVSFFSNNEALAPFEVDSNTVTTLFIPDTYYINWTTSIEKILQRLKKERDAFWDKKDRLNKANALQLTPNQVYTIASIVEEETNMNDEKGNVASVYINRYRKGMPLGADPTIKYALRDFSIKRILFGHLEVKSPYNTYRNKGLPPGPICTPSKTTIDAVLNAPNTNYYFFVAKDDFSGYHKFSETYAEHQAYAKAYQQKLDAYMAQKNNTGK